MNAALLLLIATVLVAINLLCGGVRMGFALPVYGVLVLAAALSLFNFRRVALGWPTRICLLASTLCFGYIIARTAFSPTEYLARTNLYLVIGSLLVYLLTALYVTDTKLRVLLVALLVALGVANSFVGAVQFFEGRNFMPFPLEARSVEYGSRASGFFLNPNNLAGFLEICLLMGLSMVWWGRWASYGKILCGYATAVCLGGLLMTASRGGYLSAGFGLLVFVSISVPLAIQRFRDRSWLILLALACASVVVVGGVKLALSENYMLRTRAASIYAEPTDIRLLFWKAAVRQFGLAPVVGTGAGTYLYYGRQFRSPQVQTDPMLVHNDYLQLLAEYGVVGMVAIAIFLLEHIRSGFAWLRGVASRHGHPGDTQSNSLAVTVGALSCVGAQAVHAIVDFNLHVAANALVMALLFGFLANPGGKIHEAPSVAGRVFDRSYGLLLAVLGAWMAVIVATKSPAEFFNEKAKILDAKSSSGETDQEVEKLARRGLEFDGQNPVLYSLLAKSLKGQAIERDDPSERNPLFLESIAASRRALELAPQDVTLVLALAQTLDFVQTDDESDRLFQRALDLDPNAGWVHWAYAVHLHQRGLLEQAEKEFVRAVNLGSKAAESALARIDAQRRSGVRP